MQVRSSIPLYYGKSPARGDFLKSQGQYALIQVIDQWLKEALQYAMQHPDFKQHYIALPTLDFLSPIPRNICFW
jgi:type VI secretion system protein ImpM